MAHLHGVPHPLPPPGDFFLCSPYCACYHNGMAARPSRKAARDLLRRGGSAKGTIDQWFTDHPEARVLVEEWVKMRASGESQWGAGRVLGHLRDEHGYAFSSDAMFNKWVERTWPAEYKKGVKRGA